MGGREEPASDRLKGTFGAGTTHQIIQRYCKLLFLLGYLATFWCRRHPRHHSDTQSTSQTWMRGIPAQTRWASNQVGGNHRIWAVPPNISVHSPNGRVGAIGYS